MPTSQTKLPNGDIKLSFNRSAFNAFGTGGLAGATIEKIEIGKITSRYYPVRQYYIYDVVLNGIKVNPNAVKARSDCTF